MDKDNNTEEQVDVYNAVKDDAVQRDSVQLNKEQWRQRLTAEQFHVLREKGTERAFSGQYHKHREQGIYVCAACRNHLFSSSAMFDSGTGWPSYTRPVSPQNIVLEEDRSWFMTRTEVVCAVCGGHLGHVFDDGPPPTGKRYCINSAALDFIPQKSP
ncbi:MAG: peptide-methionine (R)-S-oxide reductase MsrB [Candidatus Omnitrophota bacterium]